MRNFIKYVLKRMVSLGLHVFWLFPIQKDKILFMNDHSYTFSDNPKYLAEYFLRDESRHYKIFFSMKAFDGFEEDRIIPIRYLSLNHFYHALTASTVITNDSGIVYLPIRKKQLVINTWHGGGPYKVTGVGALDNYWYRKDLRYNASKVDYILSSCKAFTDLEAPGMLYNRNQCIECGMPRMDLFFDVENKLKARKKVFDAYGLGKSSHLFLYAPTFRGFVENYVGVIENDMLELDHRRVSEALSLKFGGDWYFAVRLHPKLNNVVIRENDIINMSQYPDSEEILLATDVLITDYSSVMWDFSYTERPCFVFATDINDYEVRRGFYCPPEKWPYPIADTNEGLLENISKFDEEIYSEAVKEHHKQYGSFEKGHAGECVKQMIDKHIHDLG